MSGERPLPVGDLSAQRRRSVWLRISGLGLLVASRVVRALQNKDWQAVAEQLSPTELSLCGVKPEQAVAMLRVVGTSAELKSIALGMERPMGTRVDFELSHPVFQQLKVYRTPDGWRIYHGPLITDLNRASGGDDKARAKRLLEAMDSAKVLRLVRFPDAAISRESLQEVIKGQRDLSESVAAWSPPGPDRAQP